MSATETKQVEKGWWWNERSALVKWNESVTETFTMVHGKANRVGGYYTSSRKGNGKSETIKKKMRRRIVENADEMSRMAKEDDAEDVHCLREKEHRSEKNGTTTGRGEKDKEATRTRDRERHNDERVVRCYKTRRNKESDETRWRLKHEIQIQREFVRTV